MAIGSYAIERDYSHYVSHAAKTVLAVVGTATKGPVNVPTVCTSVQDLVNKFGPLTPESMALYAGQYFLSQSSKLYFVRAASNYKEAIHASATLSATIEYVDESTGEDHTTQSDIVTVTCGEPGVIGNEYTVLIKDNQLQVLKAGTLLETIDITTALSDVRDTLSTGQFTYSTDHITLSYPTNAVVIGLSSIESPKALTGGADASYDKDTKAEDYILALNTLSLDSIDMNLFAVPGVSDASVITAALALAESRGDSLFLVDPPKGLTKEGVVDWIEGTGVWEKKGTEGHAAFNSSYGAAYYDWGIIYDSVNKTRVVVPPSVYVPASIAYNDRVSELWYAPAGLNRGLIRGVLESSTKLNKAEVEELYSHNINSIYEDPQAGLVIWGQKTLHKQDTALNRVNTRRLLAYLKRIIVAACDTLVFEPNDRITWNSFEMKVQPVLESVRNRRGVYEYQIVRGETIVSDTDVDNYRMPCMVLIRPTKAAEEIPIYFTITSTGADFNEVLDASGITIE